MKRITLKKWVENTLIAINILIVMFIAMLDKIGSGGIKYIIGLFCIMYLNHKVLFKYGKSYHAYIKECFSDIYE